LAAWHGVGAAARSRVDQSTPAGLTAGVILEDDSVGSARARCLGLMLCRGACHTALGVPPSAIQRRRASPRKSGARVTAQSRFGGG
jgi:hypothetical protein